MRHALMLRRVVVWALVAAIVLPAAPAAAGGAPSQWSRVIALKSDTRVVVTVVAEAGAQLGSDGPDVVEGWFWSAGVDGVVLRVAGNAVARLGAKMTWLNDVAIPRAQIAEVAVVKEGRPWYAIPLVVAAVAGGVVLCLGSLWALADSGSSGWPSGDDSAYGFLTIFALPVIMGMWAYRKTDTVKRSVKVIYRAPQPVGRTPS
jgi:hypothetical protein